MPVSRSRNLVKYVIPTMLGSVSFFLFTIVDGIFVGQGVGLMNKVKPAREVVLEFIEDYVRAAERLGGVVDPRRDRIAVGEIAGARVHGGTEVAQLGLGLAQSLDTARADRHVGAGGCEP